MGIGNSLGINIGDKLGTYPYGPELVINGSFVSDLSGWVNFSDYWQWTADGAYFALSGTPNRLSQTINGISLVKNYLVEVDYNLISGVGKVVYTGGVTRQEYFITTGVHTYSSQQTDFSSIYFDRNSTCEFYVKRVSIKEIL